MQIEAIVTATAREMVFHAKNSVFVERRYVVNSLGDEIIFMTTYPNGIAISNSTIVDMVRNIG
jgi:hypothetical protein